MNRSFVCGALALLWAAASHVQADAESPTNRYNVLFIAIDDLRPELGCYGVSHAQSPHLDRFAARSLRFNRHYVQVATCGASRYALLTGRSPGASGVTGGNNAFFQGQTALRDTALAGAQSMPELFRRSGYHTTLIGKISHTADGRVFAYNGSGDGRQEMPQAWDELRTPLGSWKRGWGIFFAYANGIHREDGSGAKALMQFVVERDEDLPDGQLATAAIDQLKRYRASGKRFFLGLGFFKPHLPFVAPKQDWEAFANVEIPVPKQGKIDSPYWHTSNEFYKYDAPHAKTRPLSPQATRHSKRAYSACVRYVDRQVGRVLRALDETDLARNTIVVVWGDHGWHLGEQDLWAKHTPFERANRSVLMMAVPGMATAGRHTDSLAATIDIYPTLLALCQPSFTKTHHALDGTNLAPVLADPRAEVRKSVTSYWRDAKSVRTPTHRLITKTGTDHVELYAVEEAPDRMRNVAQDHPELVQALRNAK